jgi:putative transcriptional regulator
LKIEAAYNDVLMEETTYLTGQLLIAMPSMLDPNFHRTVTYICEHNQHGALGLVINRPLDFDLGEIFSQLSLTNTNNEIANTPILRGGPVELERGFVIHDSRDQWESTTSVDDSIQITTSQDILTAMAAGHGPKRAIVVLGYAGWGAGQLEHEIAENAWLSAPGSPHIVFDTPYEERWQEAAGLLGVDLATISTDAGHA